MKITYIALIYFACIGTLFSQNEASKERYYKVYDSVVGIESIDLLNGKVFIDYLKSNKDQYRFFKSFNNFKGSAVIKEQPFYNLSLKYDLVEDQLILKPNSKVNFLDIKLTSKNISRFTIDSHEFINFFNHSDLEDLGLNGFLELIYEGNHLKLYSKHSKIEKQKIKANKTIYIFKKYTTYLFEYKGVFYVIKSKKSFRDIFPEKEAYINDYYKMNPRLLKNNPAQFYKLISNELNNQL
ncbi:hypothetical protein ACFS5M_08310 [Lacinutrix iliipiscaria]|uniref:GLPGLI family protein n=1 Tax=Lacinutrix iliipiscaria TaxID=1230532 RepID=A0ABW5WLR5_9FLAO